MELDEEYLPIVAPCQNVHDLLALDDALAPIDRHAEELGRHHGGQRLGEVGQHVHAAAAARLDVVDQPAHLEHVDRGAERRRLAVAVLRLDEAAAERAADERHRRADEQADR